MMDSVKTQQFVGEKTIISELFPDIYLGHTDDFKGTDTYMLFPREHLYGTDVLRIVSETYYQEINQFVVDYEIDGSGDKQKYCFVLGQNLGGDVLDLIEEEYAQSLQTSIEGANEELETINTNKILSSLWRQNHKSEKAVLHQTDANGVRLIPLMGTLIDENTLRVRYHASMDVEQVLSRLITEKEHKLNGHLHSL